MGFLKSHDVRFPLLKTVPISNACYNAHLFFPDKNGHSTSMSAKCCNKRCVQEAGGLSMNKLSISYNNNNNKVLIFNVCSEGSAAKSATKFHTVDNIVCRTIIWLH